MGWLKRRRSRGDMGRHVLYATEAGLEAAKAREEMAGLEPGSRWLKKGKAQYTIYRGDDPEKAKRYLLDLEPVTQESDYYVVETPDGNWGMDTLGLYLEELRPWQLDTAAAECLGAIIRVANTQGIISAACGEIDNFVAEVACGKCSFEWYDGLRYQNVTAVRCPACKALNKVDSGGIVVNLH